MKPSPRIIEQLKAAGEELKEVSPPELIHKEANPSSVGEAKQVEAAQATSPFAETARPLQSASSLAKDINTGEETELLKVITEYQEEVKKELGLLERVYQQIKEVKERLEQRIEFLKSLQARSTQIDKELKNFGEQIRVAKKENKALLEEIKDLK